MKKRAWTMAEMAVAMIIIIVLSYASMTSIKTTSVNQGKILMYATIKNLLYANGAISDKHGEFYPESESKNDIENGTFPGTWYCEQLKDMLTTKNTPDCSSATTTFDFSNGVKLYGIAGDWKYPYTYRNDNLANAAEACTSNSLCSARADFYYKNIMVDVNGASKPNEIGIDRFLLRIYRGFTPLGTDISGNVFPRCGTYDYVISPKAEVKYMTDLTDSTNGLGCPSGNEFITNNEVVSYNIYKVDTTLDQNSGGVINKDVTASLISGQLSLMKADCQANGGNGLFNKYQCSIAGYYLHPECAHYDLCADCSGKLFDSDSYEYNVCPEGYRSISDCKTKAATLRATNVNQACFVTINRPTSGLGYFAGAIMGDIDM